MPLYKSLSLPGDARLLVWKITETLEELTADVVLKDVCTLRLDGMKSEQHRKGFLSVRKLMQHIGYTDLDLYYDCDGKPHLNDGKTISITHSYNFAAIIVSTISSGIDMEMRREKIIKIADKFIDREFNYLDSSDPEAFIRKLTVIWGIKEALYKMCSRNGLSFRENIYVYPFEMADSEVNASVHFEDINGIYPCLFEEIEDFTLVHCTDNPIIEN